MWSAKLTGYSGIVCVKYATSAGLIWLDIWLDIIEGEYKLNRNYKFQITQNSISNSSNWKSIDFAATNGHCPVHSKLESPIASWLSSGLDDRGDHNCGHNEHNYISLNRQFIRQIENTSRIRREWIGNASRFAYYLLNLKIVRWSFESLQCGSLIVGLI